jgi:hypothetical protein
MRHFTIRHLIFLIMLLAVTIPLFLNVRLSHAVSDETITAYANIDSLPPASIVLVSFDFEASSYPEIRPLAEALLNHCFTKNLHVIGVSLFAEGTALGAQLLSDIAVRHGRRYGNDYVYLGYRPQYQAAILALGQSISKEFPTDYYDLKISDMILLKEVDNYSRIALVISIADGSMPTYWVDYAVTQYHVKFETALTATMATSFYPYLSSGQISGMVAGIKGAAEYELLAKQAGAGSRGLFAQSIAQIVVLAVIVAGNIVDLRRKRQL